MSPSTWSRRHAGAKPTARKGVPVWHDRHVVPRTVTQAAGCPVTGWRRLVRVAALGVSCYGLAVAAHVGAAALALGRTGSTRPFGLIALELGLPTGQASTVGALWRALHRGGQWQPFLTAVDALMTRLQQSPPRVNYRARRVLGDDTAPCWSKPSPPQHRPWTSRWC